MAALAVALPVKAFEGEGGAYYLWNATNLPLLSEAKVGAGKLVLQPKGFALPHYADCNKIGFVLQGSEEAKAGLISSSTTMEEQVMCLKPGDTFLVEAGSISWWFNGSPDTILEIIFLGETSDAVIPGQFTYQYISGTTGFLKSFTPNLISSAYDLTLDQTKEFLNSQTGTVAIKLADDNVTGLGRREPDMENQNLFSAAGDAVVVVRGGGFMSKFGFSGGGGRGGGGEDKMLCGVYVRLEPKAVYGPVYIGNVGSAVQVTYVARGKCWVEVVDVKGELVLSEEVEAGRAFVVPKYSVVCMVGGEEDGVECFTVMDGAEPVFNPVSSVIKAMSPQVLNAAFNLKPEFEEVFLRKMAKTTSLIIPPKN